MWFVVSQEALSFFIVVAFRKRYRLKTIKFSEKDRGTEKKTNSKIILKIQIYNLNM